MKTEGKWLLTYNDAPQIRRLYKGCRVEEIIGEVNVKAEGRRLIPGSS